MFKFIIDTEQYSGNFEREMIAYVAGYTNQYFTRSSARKPTALAVG